MVPMIGDSGHGPSIFQDQPRNLQAIETNLHFPLKIKPSIIHKQHWAQPVQTMANESIKITIKLIGKRGPTVVTTQLAIYDHLKQGL